MWCIQASTPYTRYRLYAFFVSPWSRLIPLKALWLRVPALTVVPVSGDVLIPQACSGSWRGHHGHYPPRQNNGSRRPSLSQGAGLSVQVPHVQVANVVMRKPGTPMTSQSEALRRMLTTENLKTAMFVFSSSWHRDS